MAEIELLVNGARRKVDVDPDTPLIYVLRNDLGLKGAKLACALEQCGACKVLVDGTAEFSCREPVAGFSGRRITTIEGLAGDGGLHPVQRAFVQLRAAQCGYCIPGIIIAAKALLDEHPAPDDSDIRSALRDHLCRCGTHTRIIAAIKQAARDIAASEKTPGDITP